MKKTQTDIGTAIFLLAFCAIMLVASYDIEDLGFGGMRPDAWPRFLLWILTGFSVLFLIQSLLKLRDTPPPENVDTSAPTDIGWRRYINAVWCFILFLGFLLTLDYLGMLIGGILFTFLLLSALGGTAPKKLLLHLVVAIISIGLMWMIFAFGLGVVLPEGQFLGI